MCKMDYTETFDLYNLSKYARFSSFSSVRCEEFLDSI